MVSGGFVIIGAMSRCVQSTSPSLVLPVLLSLVACLAPANAEQSRPAGIRFSEMPVGTEWIVDYLDKPRRYAYTYIGIQDNQHRLRIEAIGHPSKPGEKSRRQIAIRYFDKEGRLLRSESHLGEVTAYTPFDCAYQVGPCTHSIRYPLPPKNGRKRERTRTQRYLNQRNGDTFTLGRYSRSGNRTDFAFTLGQYNIRVHNEYTNRLGKTRGFRVTEINVPGQ